MDVTVLMKIAGIGILVSVVCQVLSKSGRDEQSMLVSIAGIVVVLLMLVDELAALLTTIRSLFGI